jgi:signal transduction histidine kinase
VEDPLTLHRLLPLLAFLLNVSLIGIALFRNPRSRLNRLFAYFIGGFALWNLGVFMLRRAPDEATATFAEIVVHVGVVALAPFYYHFVLIFLDSTSERRRSLAIAYGLAAVYMLLNLTGSSLFMRGVKLTTWGWAPAPGPLYNLFFLYFYAYLIAGLVLLGRAYARTTSSFRRNRGLLILLGTAISVAAGFVDIIRFALVKSFPALDYVYPPGIPANMLSAVLFGLAIVRYRMFDVSVAVKKFVVYGLAGAVITGVMAAFTHVGERYFNLETSSALWVIVPIGALITLLISPLGQRIEDRIQRVMFSRRRGCYDTLLELSKEMSRILDLTALMDRLVTGLVRGIPATHAVLLIYDDSAKAFVVGREDASVDPVPRATPIPSESRLVEWLRQSEAVLVKEELKLNPRIADYFDTAEGELDEIQASLIVPLKSEHKLSGILLLGEKLSGEIYDEHELGVLSLLANQAAISLENARLYEELGSSNARLVQANRHKSQFLAAVSHELRTPLNSIIGFSKVMLNRIDGDLTAQQETYLRSIHTSSQHLLQLINSVLDISSIEAGKLALQREDVDLVDLIEECLDTSAPLARGKPLKLDRSLLPELPRVSADRTKLRQVLLNLISNAVKFTPGGRVTVGARTEGDTVIVSVSDTGIGIRKADVGRLFAPFERLESPMSRGAGGTGLGLAISKMFVELHGGKMFVESREGAGSTFSFSLPIARHES